MRLLEGGRLGGLQGCDHPVHVMDVRRYGDGAAAVRRHVVDDVRRKGIKELDTRGAVRCSSLKYLDPIAVEVWRRDGSERGPGAHGLRSRYARGDDLCELDRVDELPEAR